MAEFDVTIDPASSVQMGGGSAADAVPEKFDGVRDIKAHKGVEIRNTNGTAVDLLIGYDGVAGLYPLQQGERIFLEMRHPARIRVSGDGGTVLYSWLAY